MSSQGLCPTWSTNSSVSALGVFLGTNKPPARALVSLHGTCRDIRRGFIDSSALQSPSVGTLITGSHKGPRLPGSLSAPKDAQSKLLHAINLGQLAVAAEELKRLQTDSIAVEPYTIEQLIEGEPYTALEVFRQLQHAGLTPNFVTYSGLISALGKVRRRGQPSAELAYQLWQELYQLQTPLDAAAFRTGMNACISVGKLSEARALLQDMKQQNIPADIRVFNILLKGYSRRGGVAAVAGIMQEMTDAGLKPSAVTYNTLIDTYVNAGQLPQARQMCSDALDAGVALDVWSYSALIKGYVQKSNLQAALELLQDMKQAHGVPPNEVTYSTLIDGCVREGAVDTGRQLLTEMVARGVKPNAVTYNTLLRAYAMDDKVEMKDAFGMLAEMGKEGVMPTVDTFNTLMDACIRRVNPAAVPRLFNQMEQSGYSPDAVSYTTLIRALSWLGRSNDALQAFEELNANPNAQADLYAYNAIISALSVAGRMEDAEKYLRRAAQLAQDQQEPAPVEAFGATIKGYARLNNAEAALDVLREFWQQGGEPDDTMFEVLVNLCVRTGEFRKALQVVHAMDKLGRPADKMRIKKVLEEFYRRQEKLKRRRSSTERPVNEGLERFKFWLGLPNNYYRDDWQ
ncbi:hypothetical protein ABBQ38_001179 [Trebouxia sp. C0009 RCD-2024]